MVIPANGEVQTNEDATVYVKELDLFVTVKLLEDTLAVLSRLENSAKNTDTLRADQWSITASC